MNESIIKSVAGCGERSSPRLVDLLSHIVNANHIWNQRINAVPPKYAVWQKHQVIDIPSIARINFEESSLIIDTQDLQRKISYTNSKGDSYTNSIQEILFHIVNHSTHHRAQVATELKMLGFVAPITDYIFYKR